MDKRLLFRLHQQEDEEKIQKLIRFTKEYFLMFDIVNLHLQFEEFVSPVQEDTSLKIYDLFIITDNEMLYNWTHGVTWTYIEKQKEHEEIINKIDEKLQELIRQTQ